MQPDIYNFSIFPNDFKAKKSPEEIAIREFLDKNARRIVDEYLPQINYITNAFIGEKDVPCVLLGITRGYTPPVVPSLSPFRVVNTDLSMDDLWR